MVEVKVLMALTDDESGVVGKESVRNGVDQLTEDSSSSGQRDLAFVKSPSKDSNVSKLSVERPWLSEAEGSNLPNHDTVFSKSFPSLEKQFGAEPQTESKHGHKTIKLILKSCSTRKAETLKDVIINETKNSLAPAKGNKKCFSFQKELSSCW
nr:hypothetical protein [Tanacetum cinerariifolium]